MKAQPPARPSRFMTVSWHTLSKQLRRVPLEAVIWTAGLVVLACTNPEAESLVEVCLSKLFFDTPCPGCGLGHAVAYFFHGDLAQSFQTHPLGPVAAVVLMGRVIRLLWETFAHPVYSLKHV